MFAVLITHVLFMIESYSVYSKDIFNDDFYFRDVEVLKTVLKLKLVINVFRRKQQLFCPTIVK